MENSAFNPSDIRYIKLGGSGAWCTQAFAEGIVPFGYGEVPHAACAAGDWDAVRATLLKRLNRSRGAATSDVRQIRDFYELPETALWVTIGQGHLWWTFADEDVIEVPDAGPGQPARYRRCKGAWSKVSLTGEPLTTRSLSWGLTQVAGYRGTICAVPKPDYLLRRIRGEDHPLHDAGLRLQAEVHDVAQAMIAELHWQEFETLVDLIFARGGWRRTSLLGQSMPDVDMILEQPLTGETAWVQVKTGTSQVEYEAYWKRFSDDGSCDRFFFVCHTAKSPLCAVADDPRHHLLTGQELAALAVKVGLFDWLTERTR